MAHRVENGLARKLGRGQMLLHANLLDEAKCRLDRAERLIEHLPVLRPVPQSAQRVGEVDVGLGGVERRSLGWTGLERGAIGRGRLLQLYVAVFAFGDGDEGIAKVGVGGCPVRGSEIAASLLQASR